MASHIKDWEIVRAVMFDCICLAVLTEVRSMLHAITGRRERERESQRECFCCSYYCVPLILLPVTPRPEELLVFESLA